MQSALLHLEVVDEYIQEELSSHRVVGPYSPNLGEYQSLWCYPKESSGKYSKWHLIVVTFYDGTGYPSS